MANEVAIRNSETLSIFSDPQRFETSGKWATSFAKSTLVPKEYQGNANNCLIAIEIAVQQNTSPLMVMQNLHIINGRPAWSSQYLIAQANKSGLYDFELQYDIKFDKANNPYSCQCWTERHGRKVIGPIVTMDMARAEGWLGRTGSKWKTMPQTMLMYRAASFFVRTNCPEVTLGFYSQDEVVDIGPESYTEIPYRPVEEQVQEDISANANTVAFEETVEPVPASEPEKPKSKSTTTKKSTTKKETPAPAPMPEPETVIDIEADDDAPDWA